MTILVSFCERDNVIYGCWLKSRRSSTGSRGTVSSVQGSIDIKRVAIHTDVQLTLIMEYLYIAQHGVAFDTLKKNSCLQITAILTLHSLWRRLPGHVQCWGNCFNLSLMDEDGASRPSLHRCHEDKPNEVCEIQVSSWPILSAHESLVVLSNSIVCRLNEKSILIMPWYKRISEDNWHWLPKSPRENLWSLSSIQLAVLHHVVAMGSFHSHFQRLEVNWWSLICKFSGDESPWITLFGSCGRYQSTSGLNEAYWLWRSRLSWDWELIGTMLSASVMEDTVTFLFSYSIFLLLNVFECCDASITDRNSRFSFHCNKDEIMESKAVKIILL